MALTEKDILSLLEIELPEDATVEQLQEAFNEKFISLKMAGADPRIIGRINGAMGQKLKKTFEPIVGGWEDGETDWSVPEKVAEAAVAKLSKQRENYETALAELKDASKGGSDKKTAEALAKLEQYEKEIADIKGMKDTIASEFENYKNEVLQEKRNGKIQNIYKSAFDELANEISEDFVKNPVIKEGTHTILSKKYKLDLDDDGETESVIDIATGQRVKTPNGTNYERWSNVVKRELDTLGYIKKNTGKSDVGNTGQQSQQFQQQQNNNNGFQRRMAPEVPVEVVKG